MDELSALIAELDSGDDLRAEAAARRLGAYGEAAMPLLVARLESENAEQSWWAARALAELQGDEVVPLLVERLKDEDPAVRQCAALGLCHHADKRAIPALVEAMGDPDGLTARLAANALIAIGAEVVPELIEILKNGRWSLRLEAARALALIGDARAVPALYEALDSDSALMEYWAEDGLERMGAGMVFFQP